jgi:phosphatidylethanolamine/phosphatidyl-N-methylethanolamine N-methyltransferase
MKSRNLIPPTEISKLSEKTRKRYNRIAPVYDLMEWFVERYSFRKWRNMLWDQVVGDEVLEIGVGTGKNIPFYPSDTKVTSIDLSEVMMSYAKKQAEEISREVKFQLMDVETMTFPDNSFDAAVASFVFCSVPQPVIGFKELGRVVKPGGDIWLLEHVRINRPIIGMLMDALNPIVVRMMGANINRNTVKNVETAGLKILSVTDLQGKLVRLIHARPNLDVG